jgi:hypothetical protein
MPCHTVSTVRASGCVCQCIYFLLNNPQYSHLSSHSPSSFLFISSLRLFYSFPHFSLLLSPLFSSLPLFITSSSFFPSLLSPTPLFSPSSLPLLFPPFLYFSHHSKRKHSYWSHHSRLCHHRCFLPSRPGWCILSILHTHQKGQPLCTCFCYYWR